MFTNIVLDNTFSINSLLMYFNDYCCMAFPVYHGILSSSHDMAAEFWNTQQL